MKNDRDTIIEYRGFAFGHLLAATEAAREAFTKALADGQTHAT